MRFKAKLFYFSHIPKTGGSTIETSMRQAGALRALHYHKRLDYAQCNLQHMHAELFDTFIPPDFYDTGFCVVRHPIARLVSEYYWRVSLGHVNAEFDVWVRRRLDDYQTNPYVLDNHIRPQNEFIGKKIKVFRFESGMKNILSEISMMTGLNLDSKLHVRGAQNRPLLTWKHRTKSMVLDFYEKDFEFLGYKKDIDIPHLSMQS